MEIFFGCDHNAEEQKPQLMRAMSGFGNVISVLDDFSDSSDYIQVTQEVCRRMNGSVCAGLLICGTGIGVSIIANKHKGIFAARCMSEIDAVDCRLINQANVLCLSAKNSTIQNISILKTFFNTPIGKTQKRLRRLDQIHHLEKRNFA